MVVDYMLTNQRTENVVEMKTGSWKLIHFEIQTHTENLILIDNVNIS